MIDLIAKNGQQRRWTPPSFFPAIRNAVKEKVLAGQERSDGALDIFGVDPSNSIRGMPPNYGQYMLPHVTTFQGLFGTFSRVYRTSDEALNDSWENARYMRNDIGIMECLEARKRCTSLLPWHIEPEDPDSHDQQQLAEAVTKIITRINRFTQYREVLLEGTFYGRYAIQHRYGWNDIGGREYVMPCKLRDDPGWKPVNGDKLVWRYDDGSGKYITDQVGIRVGQRLGVGSKINQRWVIEPTDRGLAYFLADWERTLLTIHRHTVEDGAWEDPIQAGMIHGVGIRHRIYWEWYQKQEALAFLMEYLERSAGGIEIHYYPEGNSTARQRAADAVKDRIANGRNVMLYPRPVGDDGNQYGVEFVEPGIAGIESLKDLLTDYFGHRIKRYILGQTLSSEAASTGLGSGVADLHYDTLQQIVRYDAVNLEETLTDDLVRVIQHWNFPRSKGIYLRFRIEVETPNVTERLDALAKAWELGAKISNQQLMDTIGAEVPTDPADVLQNPEIAQAKAAIQAPGFGPGANGETNPPDGPDEIHDKIAQKLYSDPEDAGPGAVVHANEAGEWVERQIPALDTGERIREPYEADGDVYHLKRPGQQQAYKHSERSAKGNELDDSLGIERKEMPQILKSKMLEFLEGLKENGIGFEKKQILPDDLKPTQKELNAEKIKAFRNKIRDGETISEAPIIASSDLFVMDGHHRWEAQRLERPKESIDVNVIDLPIDKLLEEAHAFEGVKYRSVEHFTKRFAQEVVRYSMKPGAAREFYRRLSQESVT